MADNNVGSCQVFHVTALATDRSHPYDSIALEIDGEMFYDNNLSTSGNQKDNSVTITEPGKVPIFYPGLSPECQEITTQLTSIFLNEIP